MKKIIGYSLASILILAVLILKIYFYYSLPDYKGELVVDGISTPVDVYTDEWGVPHIFAENDSDLFFAAGYIAARERLWQMTIVASAARGELSQLLGRRALEDDVYLRTWRIPEMGRRLAADMSPEAHVLLQRFCDGINATIEELGGSLPPEFKILNAKPVHWQPSDVCGYARLMAHDLQQSWKPEILFGAVLENFGADRLSELLPPWGPDKPTIAAMTPPKGLTELFSHLWERESRLRDLTGANGGAIGSNSWVISGTKTLSGQPLLANDPHLGFTQPPKWFEMQVSGGSFNISGVCLAGIPVPVIGQNDAIAWGFTNVMADDIDFFIETIHPDEPDLYLSGDEWLPFDKVLETIPIKGEPDTSIVVRISKHGPVISDIHPLLKAGSTVVSMQWTGLENFPTVDALLELCRAKDWDSFSKAVADFGVPGQNMIYADTAGNIGWRPAVKVPVRKAGGSLVPRPGKDPSYDWKGYVPFREMPFLFNPKSGYIATANNKTIGDDFPYYVSNLWTHPSRIERIHERLRDEVVVTPEDVMSIQTDYVSVLGRFMAAQIVALIELDSYTANQSTALRLLRDWDGDESPDSPAALVYQVTLKNLITEIYKDELDLIGPAAFEAYVSLPMIPLRNIEWVFREKTSSWIDNVQTPNYRETLSDIVGPAFADAVAEIEKTVGYDPQTWSWGAVHTLTHPHALGSVAILDRLFNLNVGPFKSGGSSLTVNNGEFSYRHPFNQIVGPSMRRIVDFSNLNETRFILPTGQSGLPRSPHYRDQAAMYNAGEYRTTYFDEAFIRGSDRFQHLVLTPKE